jgi:hypothetical protein
MTETATLQKVLNRFLDPTGLDAHRWKVCRHLPACRTPAMGGRERACDRCQSTSICYYGCRDRHCPQCQGRATRQWAEQQRDHLLPVPYYHLVFTLPHQLNGWVQLHPEVIYRLLFQATWQTLKAFAEDPKRLGGQLGMSAILHTWGQTLSQHVHLHCLVPGGVLKADGRWQATRGTYLFPVRALSRRFRGCLVSGLRQAANGGELFRVTNPGEVNHLLDSLMRQEWVVYTKHCLNHTESVVDYLARYTHRIAVSNGRLLNMDEERVRLRYKDYRDDRSKVMTLRGEELVRRYLLHVLPKGLMRIRHFGFLSNRHRRLKLTQIRSALALPTPEPSSVASAERTGPAMRSEDLERCPRGRVGGMRVKRELPGTLSRWRTRG